MPDRKKCPACGTMMHRFMNPERYVCPKENTHAALLAEKRRAEGRSRGGKAAQAKRAASGRQREWARILGKRFGGKNKKSK